MAAYTTIDDPSAYFQTAIYTGNGGSSQAVTFDGNSDMQPDWLWLKVRSHGGNHFAYDSVRGATKALVPNDTDAEDTSYGYFSSFDSDGFTLGSSDNNVNGSGRTYVGWGWKKQAGVFDIQTYTGNGSNRTISHNLGAVPTMMITKVRSTTNQWLVYHQGIGNTNTVKIDDASASTEQTNLWNSTTPTSSVFSVGTHTGSNLDGGTFVIYLFGDKQGVSKMGSYTGNGNADGTFVYTGFKPAFVIRKVTSASSDWIMQDNKRSESGGSNMIRNYLFPNSSQAEVSSQDYFNIDFLSNGFKMRSTDGGANGSGSSYIYMAFAENPFVTSTGVPATAR